MPQDSKETSIQNKPEPQSPIKKPKWFHPDSMGHYEKFIGIVVIALAVPITLGLALNRQNYLGHADSPTSDVLSDASAATTRSKFVMGVSTQDGLADKDPNTSKILAAVDSFSAPLSQGGVGQYPGGFTLFNNFSETNDPDSPRSTFPNSTILHGLDSRGITPVIYMQPVGANVNRADGKFKFASDNDPATIQPGEIKFDSLIPAAVTKVYLSKTGTALNAAKGVYPNVPNLVNSWTPGSRFTIYPSTATGAPNYASSDKLTFTVTNTTDTGLYWLVSVKPVAATQSFKNNSIVWPSMSPTDNAKQYSNDSIVSGSMDSYFRTWANRAKTYGKPVVLRYAHEMNGGWFPWAPGQPTPKDEYGRYIYFNVNNSPDNYVTAWRHIYNVVKPIAPNVKFFWCPYMLYDTTTSKYFPGASYVDYVGFDAYQWNGSAGPSMNSLYATSIKSLRAFMPKNSDGTSKIPMIVGETGIASLKGGTTNGYRKSWLSQGYPSIYSYKDVAGIIYFDFNLHQANWDLTGNPSILSAYANIASNPNFQGSFSPVVKPKPSITTSKPTPTKKPTLTVAPTPIVGKQMSVSVSADSFVSATEPTTNFGNQTILRVNGSGVVTYIKFNLSDLNGKTIDKVSLRMTTIGESDSGSAATAQVFSVSDNSWGESSLNNNNKPSAGGPLGSFNPTQTSTNYSSDLNTAFFQNHAGGLVSVVIKGSEGDNMIFNSKESPSTKPILVITYH